MKALNLKPQIIRCQDCQAEFFEWRMLFLHWRKANNDFTLHAPNARRYLPHWRPSDRNAKLTG